MASNKDDDLSPLERYLAKNGRNKSAPEPMPDSTARSTSTSASRPILEPAVESAPLQPPRPAPKAETKQEPVAQTPRDLRPAGFFRRFFAYWIDIFIISGLTGAAYNVFGSIFDFIAWYKYGAGYFIALQAVTILYAGWFYGNKGATPGKMIFGLEVRRTPNGVRLGYVRAYLRESFGKYISGLLLGFGFFMALFTKDNKALHDLVLDTEVVRKN